MTIRNFILTLIFLGPILLWAQCKPNAGRDTTICVGSSYVLNGGYSDHGSGYTYDFNWSGSGTFSCATCSTTTFTATTSGTYSVWFRVTEKYNGQVLCKDSDAVVITVINKTTASFNFAPNNVCSGTVVNFTFTGSNTGPYSWNFGDPASGTNNNSNVANPSHQFSSSGTTNFTVKLKTGVPGTCADSATRIVSVQPAPDGKLYAPGSNFKACGDPNFKINVRDSTIPATGNTSYRIIWGDSDPDYVAGSSGLPASGVTKTYGIGVFTITYLVTGANGCVDTSRYTVSNVKNPSIGVANPGGTSGCSPLTVCFPITNYSGNHSSTTYDIDFGDGSITSLSHPPPDSLCHTYTKNSCPGEYTFTIRARNGCDASVATNSPIKVSGDPYVKVFQSDTIFCKKTSISFANLSNVYDGSCNSNVKYAWDYGDGSRDTTNGAYTTSHTYNSTGKFKVKLTAFGCYAVSDSMYVYIEDTLSAGFVGQSTACSGAILTFDNTSTKKVSYSETTAWSFGFTPQECSSGNNPPVFVNGTSASSYTPKVKFNDPGVYEVTLNYTNSCGTSTAKKTLTVNAPPRAKIDSIPDLCSGDSIRPKASYKKCGLPINTYDWAFNNGTPAWSYDSTPGYIKFPNVGTQKVRLLIFNGCGSSADSIAFNVLGRPSVNVQDTIELCQGDTLKLTASATGATSYSWTGPQSFYSNQQNPIVVNMIPMQTGNYTATAFNNGCQGPSKSTYVKINSSPLITVARSKDPICVGDSSKLTPSGATTYNWTSSPTLTTNGDIATVKPTVTTTYTLTGTNSGECPRTVSVTITVNQLPIVSCEADRTECNQPIPVQLSGNPTGGSWSGPNVSSSGSFTPNGTGTFKVYYSVTDKSGCVGKDSMNITVVPATPADAGTGRTVCVNDPNFNLSGSPTPGSWSGTNVNSTGTYSPVTAGTFNIVYSYGSGTCLTTDTIQILVNSLPVVDAGNDFSVCVNAAPVVLTPSPAGGSWTGTAVTPTGTFTPATAGVGSYNLTYSYTNTTTGCKNADVVIATVNPAPSTSAGPDTTVCNQPIATQLIGSPVGGAWSGTGVTSGGSYTQTTTGTYTLSYTATNGFGCSNTDTKDITVITPTAANAGSDLSKCIGGPSFTMSGTPTPGTWSGPNITSAGQFTPSTAGTFTLTYSQSQGSCLTTDQAIVTVNSLPNVSVGNDVNTCINTPPFQLFNSPIGGTWTGSSAVTPSGTFSPAMSGTGTYILTYTYTHPGTGCSNSDNLQIRISAAPVVNAGLDTTICNQPFPANFKGTPVGGSWSGPNVTSTGSYTPAAAGKDTLVYTYAFTNGCATKDTMVVTAVDPVLPNAGADLERCVGGGAVSLTGSPSGGSWSGANVTPAGVFTPSSVGTFTLTYSVGTGNCRTADQMDIIVHSSPIVSAGPSQAICFDASPITLNSSPSGGVWTGTGVNNLGVFDPSIAGLGSRVVTYTYTDPTTTCSSAVNVNINVLALPIVSAGPDRQECNGTANIGVSGTPAGGTWSGPHVTSNGTYHPVSTGNEVLTYTYTNPSGCTALDQMNIEIIDAVPVYAGKDTIVCQNSGILNFIGTPSGGIWSGLNMTTNGSFNPSSSGVINLIYSRGSGTCLTRDTVVVNVVALPSLVIGPATSDCIDKLPYQLAATPVGGIWTGTGVSSAGVFNPVSAGLGTQTLTYTYVDPNTSCRNTAIKNITVNPLPSVNAGPNKQLCDQPIVEQFTGTPSGGTWSGPDVKPNGEYTPNGRSFARLFYTFTDNKGCSNVDSTDITLNSVMPVTVPNDFERCFGTNDTLLVGSPGGGLWSGQRITNGGSFNFGLAGTFKVIYSLGAGTCRIADTVQVKVNALPLMSASNLSACTNIASVPVSQFNAKPVGGTFTSSYINAAQTEFAVQGLSSGQYVVQYDYTDALGCSNSIQPIVTVYNLPVVTAGADQTFCNTGIPGQLVGSPNVPMGQWSGTRVLSNGTYPTNLGPHSSDVVYTYTDAHGCVNSDTAIVTVIEPVPLPTSGDTSLCINSPMLILPNDGGSWTGVNVTTNGIFTPNQAGSFRLSYNRGNGTCLLTDTIEVLVNSLPFVQIGADTNVCSSSPDFVLKTTFPGLGTWSGPGIVDPQSGQFSPSLLTTGSYPISFSYTDPITGCSSQDQQIITIAPQPQVLTSGADTLCDQGNPVLFSASPAGGTWSGSNISPSGIFTPTGTGNFTLVYSFTDANGCSASDQLNLVVQNPPVVSAGLDVAVCQSASPIQLSGSPSNGKWSGTSLVNPLGAFVPSQSGTYVLTYTVTQGLCVVSDQRTVVVNALPVLSAGAIPDQCNNNAPVNLSTIVNPVGGSWSGNGVSGNTVNPKSLPVGTTPLQYTYVNPQTGCSKDTILPIKVLPLPFPQFTAPSSVCAGSTVAFTNQSTSAISHKWTFGDGGQSSITNATHVYQSTGIYNPWLKVSNNLGCSDSISRQIEVIDVPVASFAMSDSIACASKLVSFNFTGTSYYSSYQWNFTGPQGFNYVTTTFPISPFQFTNTSSGDQTYYISLQLTNQCGIATYKDSIVLSVNTPKANFNMAMDTACANSPLNLINLSSVNSVYSNWYFGDGTQSNVKQPGSHTYPNQQTATTYPLKLVTTNGCGKDSVVKPVVIYPSKPTAFAQGASSSGCVPFEFSATATSLGAESYFWNFGDGNYGNTQQVSHLFTSSGNYPVRLIAINRCSKDTMTLPIVVNPLPPVNFEPSTYITCGTEPIVFKNLTPGAVLSNWIFGDFMGSADYNTVHSYSDPGVFLVTLEATDLVTGCYNSITKPVKSVVKPQADLQVYNTVVCTGSPLVFTNNSSNVDQYIWNFGDGQSWSGPIPDVSYQQTGKFKATVVVFNSNGCTDTTMFDLTVNQSPTAGFKLDPSVVSYNYEGSNIICEALNFDAVSYSIDNEFVLNECEGHFKTDSLKPGSYLVHQLLTTAEGCTDSAVQYLTILPEVYVFVPNAFTPATEDTINDTFKPSVLGFRDYEFTVFDRWGKKIHVTNHLEQNWWNGRMDNQGEILIQDTYIWKLTGNTLFDEKKTMQGHVTLVK